MRALLTLLTTVALGVGLCACGGQGTSAHSHSSAAKTVTVPATGIVAPTTIPGQGSEKSSRDYAREHELRNFGDPASPADRRAIAALVKRYYKIALARQGAAACALIYITLAEAVAEDYGRESAGPSYLSSGTTCPAVMTLLFAHEHALLATELPSLKVVGVRLKQHYGLALLSFGRGLERQIDVRKQAGTWKIDALLDSQLA